MHWPFYQYKTARNRIQSPLHQVLEEQGACFGEVAGYEPPELVCTGWRQGRISIQAYKRQNWFEFYAEEHMAMRESVGIYDISSFGKFEVSGPDRRAGAAVDLCRKRCGGSRQSGLYAMAEPAGRNRSRCDGFQNRSGSLHDYHGDRFSVQGLVAPEKEPAGGAAAA